MNANVNRDVEGELYTLDKMITSLVELLEEKGILTYEEWEMRLRKNIKDAISLTRFEDLER
jgi:hypothetical protein